MSMFARRYAKYLNAKSYSYRMMAYDFCRIERGYVNVNNIYIAYTWIKISDTMYTKWII